MAIIPFGCIFPSLRGIIINKPADLPKPEVLGDDKRRNAWIIYQLKLRGLSLADLARKFGAPRFYPGQAIRKPWPKWENRIARALGREPQEIFPERYDENGTPHRRPVGRPRGKANAKRNELRD
ncbi:MAG: helix-turn-helix domain-containing protein [Halioglobus sp.]